MQQPMQVWWTQVSPIYHRLLCNNCKSFQSKTHQESMPVPRQSPYGHHIWWLCFLRGASLRPLTSWCSYKILLAWRDVIIIIHIKTSELELFKADAGRLPHRFHSDFDMKLIDGNALQWILSNSSNIIAAPSGRQSSNVLSECTWRTIIQMARAFIT